MNNEKPWEFFSYQPKEDITAREVAVMLPLLLDRDINRDGAFGVLTQFAVDRIADRVGDGIRRHFVRLEAGST